MTLPSITAMYLGVLGLLYAFLGLRVARFRRGNKIAFGDADNLYLRSATERMRTLPSMCPSSSS